MDPNSSATMSEEALSLYREARFLWHRRTPISVRMAIRCLERAISIDGGFAIASAALADCYSILLDYGVISPREGMMAARLASGRALYQGPELAESLAAAALVRQMDLDWPGAETEFRSAIDAYPDYAVARQRYALFLAVMGRAAESLREIEAALRLDPRSPAVAASAAWVEYYRGEYRPAMEKAQEASRRHPHFSSAEVVLTLSSVELGNPGRGAAVLEQSLAREADNVSLLSLLSYVRGREGHRKEAERLRARLESWARDRYVSPYYLAVPSAGLLDHDRVLRALEKGWKERSPQLIYLRQEPIFRPLRANRRFQELVQRLGFPRSGVGEGSPSFEPIPTREAV